MSPRPLLTIRPRRTARRALTRADRAWAGFVGWFNRLDLGENAILLGFGVAIGAVAALGVVGFYGLIDLAFAGFWRWPLESLSRAGFVVYRPVLTAVGLAAAWTIMRRIGRGHEGLNVPDVQVAVARRGGYLPLRPALARTGASAVTLGAGGSAGSEGPVAVLGAVVGSTLGHAFRFNASRIRVLVAAGTAAGISAAFNAPLAGAFFALEEILGTLTADAFPAVVVSSVVAAVVSHAFLGNHPAFPIPVEYGYALQREVLLFYPLLGVLMGLVAVLMIRVYFKTGDIAKQLPVPAWLLPWIGGLAVGGLVVASNGVLVGHGHLAVHLDVFGRLPPGTLALLALGSILATSITLNFGGSGGLFTPSLYVGAAAGGALGAALVQLFPDLGLRPEPYALVGMGAVVAATTGAPLTGILLVFEMTKDYAIVLPLMLATVIAYLVARRTERDNLYSGWLRRRGEHIEHGADRDVLSGLTVADAYERHVERVSADLPAAQLLPRLARGDLTDIPVVDDEGGLVGLVAVSELGRVAAEERDELPHLVAADLADEVDALEPRDALTEAIRRMGVRGSAVLPVVEPRTGRFLGLLSRAHVLGLYARRAAGDYGVRSTPSAAAGVLAGADAATQQEEKPPPTR
ncbi:MAG TPA: chloride channel protein [Gemmatimonadales bacterium]|nr:chloride channel protein [Gemmatimonadales bacterium]